MEKTEVIKEDLGQGARIQEYRRQCILQEAPPLPEFLHLEEVRRHAGSLGVVYITVQKETGKQYALKRAHAGSTEYKTHTERELRFHPRLHHPNILRAYGAFRAKEGSFLVMEVCSDPTLEERFQGGPLPAEDLRSIGYDVADALDYLHNSGLCHMDVKPSNIFTAHGRSARLFDCGLMMAVGDDEGSRKGCTIGTPLYLSPEQARSNPPTPADDVYSLGATLYHAATGQPPFSGTHALTVICRKIYDDPQPPIEIVPSLPADLNEAILTAIQRDPANRYQTAREFQDALSSALL